MITITNDQLGKLAAPDDEALLRVTLEFLRNELSGYVQGIPGPALERMARLGLKRARSYGFSSVDDLLTFVGIMFEVSPSFHTQPDIHAVLTDSSIRTEKKLDLLTDPRFDAAWDDADQNYDSDAWVGDD